MPHCGMFSEKIATLSPRPTPRAWQAGPAAPRTRRRQLVGDRGPVHHGEGGPPAIQRARFPPSNSGQGEAIQHASTRDSPFSFDPSFARGSGRPPGPRHTRRPCPSGTSWLSITIFPFTMTVCTSLLPIPKMACPATFSRSQRRGRIVVQDQRGPPCTRSPPVPKLSPKLRCRISFPAWRKRMKAPGPSGPPSSRWRK